MMKFLFLGTGASYPGLQRNASSLAVQFLNGSIWLFDCGEGTQVQMQKVKLSPKKIKKIFITHLHGDHLFGLPGFLCSLFAHSYVKKDEMQDKNMPFLTIDIYGPLGLKKFLFMALSLSRSPLSIKYRVHELEPALIQYPSEWKNWEVDHSPPSTLHPAELEGNVINPFVDELDNVSWKILDDDEYSVEAGIILHKIPSFGFVIKEKDIQGTLLVEKLITFGVQPGPEYGKLKSGEDVILESGERLCAKDFLGPCLEGRTIVICGDTFDASRMKHLIKECDVVVHEATHDDSLKEKAMEYGHSTPSMAVEFCKNINGKTLIMNHISQRYANSGEKVKQGETTDLLLEQAKVALKGTDITVMCAYDLFEFNLSRPKRLQEI